MKSFLETKNEFDKKYELCIYLEAFLPIHLTQSKKVIVKNNKMKPNEEYFKWQFFYALVYSGMYPKENIGAEVYFPKGNKNSAPIKFDGAVFDSPDWAVWYKEFHEKQNQDALDWIRKHIVITIEFKKEDGKNVEQVYNQQLKPAIKESEAEYCLGILYDEERLFIFQRKNGNVIRFNESYNQKGDKSTTKELSLHLTDAYINLPNFDELIQKINKPKGIDRTKRTLINLDLISGVHSKQINDAMSQILRVMDNASMVDIRGYQILLQILALKIYDEKENEKNTNRTLSFFISDDEKRYTNLNDNSIQQFIKRIIKLQDDAEGSYYTIFKGKENKINYKNENHIRVVVIAVEQFQDFSFIKSYKTDLYQLVFYRFANEFSKDKNAQFVTPLPLIDFLVSLVNPRNGETIIDPTVGIGDFLSFSFVNSNSKLDDNNIFGVDNDDKMIALAQINMLLNGDGNAKLFHSPDKGSILSKVNNEGEMVELIPSIHKRGNWDNWHDNTKLKKFDVVLTNPPFGEDRKYEPKSQRDKEIIELYELWHVARCGNWIDKGLIFLENSYRILKENGRLGIVLSNSIASIERWEQARKWLLSKMRIVAIFDLPANVFADTGVNITLIIAYKPSDNELNKLLSSNYKIFAKDIQNIGYKVRTSKRVKFFYPIYKIDETTFNVKNDNDGNPILEEDFSDTIFEFRDWCLGQEKTLQDLFIKGK